MRIGRWGRSLAAGVLIAASALAAADAPRVADEANEALARYVARPDASYGWREVSSGRIGSGEYHELILTSQTWRGVPWSHQLVVFRPRNMAVGARQGILFIHGGRWRPEYLQGWSGRLPRQAHIFAELAEAARAPLAVLRHVPYQPLFERTEDALIAYTFDHYLDTGESDWPLLLPMVKSAVRGMDAVQEFARGQWGLALEEFTVSGASKRGWTSWLTAAVDSRVSGVAPMVIDMLDLPAQIELQKQTFGGLSQEVRDYQDIDLPGRIGSERGQRLLAMVDPISYRDRLTQQKLILLGTNDRYWPLDALKLYWERLPEPKSVLYVPNQGHGVRDVGRLVATLSALHRHIARGEPLPRLSWRFERRPDVLTLEVSADRAPRAARIWSASSTTRDFREARWVARPCRRTGSHFACRASTPAGRYTASYAEVSFRRPGERGYSLSTIVCIVGAGEAQAEDCL